MISVSGQGLEKHFVHNKHLTIGWHKGKSQHVIHIFAFKFSHFLGRIRFALVIHISVFSASDSRPAGLEEADQPSVPGEQVINMDNTGHKLADFTNRPPGK